MLSCKTYKWFERSRGKITYGFLSYLMASAILTRHWDAGLGVRRGVGLDRSHHACGTL